MATRTRRPDLSDWNSNADNIRGIWPRSTRIQNQSRTHLHCRQISKQRCRTLQKRSTASPNGRKRDTSIPEIIRQDPRLMRHLARELLATDGVLGFYNSAHGPHKYPRIQITMTAGRVIEQLVRFLRDELGV